MWKNRCFIVLEEDFYSEYKFVNIISHLTDEFMDIEHGSKYSIENKNRQFYTYLTL